jgi:undecaprenyl-diphosphatase
LPDGDGLTIVANVRSGTGYHWDLRMLVRYQLPHAKIVEVEPGGDLDAALAEAAEQAQVLGVAGGDGTVNAAAAVALAHEIPLAVFPTGTLNHFAADLGLDSGGQTVLAIKHGSAVAVDIGRVDGLGVGTEALTGVFVNTASFGSYPDMVAIRERFEPTIGKWPAMVVALIYALRGERPIDVEIDGLRRQLWLVFVGNGIYQPDGFAPTYRQHLDEGLLDVRLVDAAAPFARTRLVFAVLTGRLGRSHVYEERSADRVVVSAGGRLPLPFARDGEVQAPVCRLMATVNPQPLIIYRPQ